MAQPSSGGVLRLQAVLANRKYKASQMPGSQQQATTTSPAQQSPATQRQVGSLSANPQSPGAQQKAPDSPLLKIAPLPKQSQIDPVHNNSPSSSANGQYPYQPQQQRAQEPVVTSTDGTKSSKPVEAQQHQGTGVLRLQAVLANRRYEASQQPASQQQATTTAPTQQMPASQQQAPQLLPSQDNSANLKISEQLGYLPVNYQEMVEYTQKQSNKDFDRLATFSGISRLGAALSGANADYQSWWR